MKIVITDGVTLNPGDLDWAPFDRMGKVEYYDSTLADEIVHRCIHADVIITNKTLIPRELIMKSASLKLIAVSATGYNNVDVQAATEKGVVVCNVPEYGTWSVAQHTFAMLLELTNNVGRNVASTKNDEWTRERWSYTRAPIIELKNKVLGIVGYGRIGRKVADIARAFGMEIIFSNRSFVEGADARQVSTEELFMTSDVVSLHCPLTETTKAFVNLALLRTMKPGAFLINTSRGALVNEDDLFTALEEKCLTAAALDVLTQEPPAAHHPLVHHPRCIVTPHNAWISFEARSRLMDATLANVQGFLNGMIQNRIA